MQGSTCSDVPRRRKPRIHSTPARYIQPAAPVYQRPAAAARVRSARSRRRRAMTYGSTL